jgi:hypothetical protein
VTNGGHSGTSGKVARWEGLALIGMIALGLVQALVNVASFSADRANNGLRDLGWELWLWELSSWVGLTAMLPFVLRAARTFRPPLLPWAAVPLAHLPASMLVSGGHVAIMLAIRQLGYAIAGRTYEFFGSNPAGTLIYEFRKDIMFYTGSVVVLLLVRALAESRTDAAAPAQRIEVRDGARTLWLEPAEIVSAEAAGNYVQLVTSSGPVLHRATLAAMEARLGDDFVRIHRSRLVRRTAIRELRADGSGDFELALSDGRTLGGSRRYRDRVRL